MNQHIYKDNPPPKCYFYEFHVADSLGTKGSASPPDHVDLTVTLHINAGVVSSQGVYVHFDCSALKNSDIVINSFSHDTNTIAAPPPVHDVAAITQTPSPTTVTQGETVTIDVTVENQGTEPETFDVTCYYDSGVVDTLTVTNLAAGDSTTLNFYWDTTGVAPATYTIKAWADSGAVITEADEMDNWCTASVTVTVKVHDVAAVSQVPDVTNVQQGGTVNIDVTVQNLGNFTESFNVTCYYDSIAIGTQRVSNLASGASTTLTFIWITTGVAPSTYYIKAQADSSFEIAETDETNNWCTSLATVTVYIPGQPGALLVDKARTAVVSGPHPPVVGFTTVYELTITALNPGGSTVTDVTVIDYISGSVTFVSVGTPPEGEANYDPGPPRQIVWTWTASNPFNLDPGDSQTLTFQVSVTPSASGLLYLDHKEDLSASGTDSYTGNPVSDPEGDTDITVTAIVRDVAAVSQVPSSATVTRGETVAVDVIVQNRGTQPETFDVTCYYSDGITDTQIGTLRVYTLSAGGSTTLTFAWDTTGIAPGSYDVKAQADSSSEIAETDETNNWCTAAAAVTIVIHDLAAITQIPTPTSVTQGETVTIDVTVENQGMQSETFGVTCYYDNAVIGTQTVTNLASGASTTLTFIWDTTSVTPGTYSINAWADSGEVITEIDENNNWCTSPTTVEITALPPPPPPPVGGEWVQINKFELLFPWIGLTSLILSVVAATAVFFKCKRKKQ